MMDLEDWEHSGIGTLFRVRDRVESKVYWYELFCPLDSVQLLRLLDMDHKCERGRSICQDQCLFR
jgi:hypothetical protein